MHTVHTVPCGTAIAMPRSSQGLRIIDATAGAIRLDVRFDEGQIVISLKPLPRVSKHAVGALCFVGKFHIVNVEDGVVLQTLQTPRLPPEMGSGLCFWDQSHAFIAIKPALCNDPPRNNATIIDVVAMSVRQVVIGDSDVLALTWLGSTASVAVACRDGFIRILNVLGGADRDIDTIELVPKYTDPVVMVSSPCGGTIGLFGAIDVWIVDVATSSVYTRTIQTGGGMWARECVKWAPDGSTIVASTGVWHREFHVFHKSKRTYRYHAIGFDRTLAVPQCTDGVLLMKYLHEYRSPPHVQGAAGSEVAAASTLGHTFSDPARASIQM